MCCTFKINGNVDTNHANYGFVCGLAQRGGSSASNKYSLRYL